MIRRALGAVALALTACRAAPVAVPRGCPTGEIRVHGQSDLAGLAGCETLTGLVVRTAAPLDLAPLADLVRVDGDLAIGPTLALGTIRLPALREVAGAVRIVSNTDLQGIFLPALARAGSLAIADDLALLHVSAPALVEVAGDLRIERAPSLELIETASGPRVHGSLTVRDVPRLATWIAPPTVAGTLDVLAPALADGPTSTQP